MAKTPFFSIGVTTYKRTNLLKKTLLSLKKQSFKDFEVIVSNDNETRKISLNDFGIKDKRFRLINQAKNLGESNNMNFLLKQAKGKYFTWLADDDLYHRNFLEKVYNAIKDFAQLEVVYTGFTMAKKFPKNLNVSNHNPILFSGQEFLKKYLKKEIKLLGCYGIFKRKYLISKKGMPKLGNGFLSQDKKSIFYPYGDNYLAVQSGLSSKVVYIDLPLVLLRPHMGSVSVVSTNLKAYRTAQQDLLKKCQKIFKSKNLKKDYISNLFLLYQWFLRDYLAVLRRSKTISVKEVFLYTVFIKKFIFKFLKKPHYVIKATRFLLSSFIGFLTFKLKK